MDKTKKVKVSIVSPRGDDTKVLPSQEALALVQTEVNSRGKWLYLDGKYTSVSDVSKADLERANDIVLGDTLVGG